MTIEEIRNLIAEKTIQINTLKKELQELRQQNLQAEQDALPFKVGEKVFVCNGIKKEIGIFQGLSQRYSHTEPLVSKIKKDGSASKLFHHIFYETKIVPFE